MKYPSFPQRLGYFFVLLLAMRRGEKFVEKIYLIGNYTI